MEKLNIEKLEDPRKLAEVLGNEMVELANILRREQELSEDAVNHLTRCLLLSGMAAGMILKLTKEHMST